MKALSNDMDRHMQLSMDDCNLFAQIDVKMENIVVAASCLSLRNSTPIPKLYAFIIPTRNYELSFLSKLRKCPEIFHLVREVLHLAEEEKETTYTQDTAAECPPTV